VKRVYHVVAIPIRIVFNRFGDHDPYGRMYVLKENEQTVLKQVAEQPYTPVELVQPLVIRANSGDEVEILFENKLEHAASMHFQNIEYDVRTSDGANVGLNPDTTVQPGGQIVYSLTAIREDICYFSDLANPLSTELGSVPNGMYGALIVERRGSYWTDPVTGGPLSSGVFADVHHPLLPSFREYAWVFHDEPFVIDLTGNDRIDPMTFQDAPSVHAVNYRSEPLSNRLKLIMEGVVCPDCEGEEVHHDSWVFGDPSTPILRGYVGDPAKIRLIHGGVKETHTFHYHVHQWLSQPEDIESEIIDVQAISPQTTYNIEPLYGLGSLHKGIGDVIIHCHLYPHFEAGMWGLNRIFDTLQDGTQCYPNGVPIAALQPLPGRPLPPAPTPERPGFPNFIPGKVGFKAPRPPLGIVGGRGMTELEANAAVPCARPGAVFVDSCLGNPVVVEFNISAIEIPIIYNNQGWYDPKGRIYVLDEDLDDVCSGRKPIEPLVIHAEAGSCIRINFTNRLPNVLSGDAFQLVTRTYETGLHVHFVKFDVLASDGGNVGWNYSSGVLPGETMRYEWYADVELRQTLFHDHLFATAHQHHGLFGSIVIQPRFSTFLDSCTGEPVRHGTQLSIINPLLPDYRDFTLFVHDFALLFDQNDCPLSPPPYPGSLEDPGVFGVNYRCEPLQFRALPDPAYSFSSYVHGDPATPVFFAYAGDPIRIRLLQGAQEESHSFNLHGLRWPRERRDLESPLVSQQHIGTAESFTFEMFIPRSGDYLYAFETVEDVWLGTWGLIRAYGEQVDDLIVLTDQSTTPPPRTRELPVKTGELPPPARVEDGDPICPGDALLRCYHVVAFQMPVLYSKYGEHDPYGIVFALAEEVEDILAGRKPIEPLVLRVNTGERLEVTLTNNLRPELFHNRDGLHEYPTVKEIAFYPTSLRISLHPQLVEYDVKTSGGETVGYNPDQTVGPGESITYHWFADVPLGSCNLWDMADLRNHRHHGAFGALIVEPKGSKYLCPHTLEPVRSGTHVIIDHVYYPSFREFVLVMHDGIRLEDAAGRLIQDPTPIGGTVIEEVDTYDQGSRGYNYRTERLQNRLQQRPVLHDSFSSKAFGDPSTPLFEAYVGDSTTFRLLNPAERRRAHSFHLHGHSWRLERQDVFSHFTSMQGAIVAGFSQDAPLSYGAGSYLGIPGDYMYRSGNNRWDIELGMWGIMRVHEHTQAHLPRIDFLNARKASSEDE